MDMLNNSETSFKNIFIIFHEQDLAQFFILDRPLFFHRKDPNKIEIEAIKSLAELKQGIGRGTAAFRQGCSLAVDRRWGRSFRGPRRFTRAAWRGLGWPERLVPTATRDGGEREIDGEVVSVLMGGDGGAGELHKNKAKLLEGLVWIEKRRGELPTAARSDGNGTQRRRQCLVHEKKKGASEWVKEGPQQLDSGVN
jgi:hypothetical protein